MPTQFCCCNFLRLVCCTGPTGSTQQLGPQFCLQFYCTVQKKTKSMIEAQTWIWWSVDPRKECCILHGNWPPKHRRWHSSLGSINHHVRGLSLHHFMLCAEHQRCRSIWQESYDTWHWTLFCAWSVPLIITHEAWFLNSNSKWSNRTFWNKLFFWGDGVGGGERRRTVSSFNPHSHWVMSWLSPSVTFEQQMEYETEIAAETLPRASKVLPITWQGMFLRWLHQFWLCLREFAVFLSILF